MGLRNKSGNQDQYFYENPILCIIGYNLLLVIHKEDYGWRLCIVCFAYTLKYYTLPKFNFEILDHNRQTFLRLEDHPVNRHVEDFETKVDNIAEKQILKFGNVYKR